MRATTLAPAHQRLEARLGAQRLEVLVLLGLLDEGLRVFILAPELSKPEAALQIQLQGSEPRQAWRAFRRLAQAASSPPSDPAVLERPVWDAAMARTVLAHPEAGEGALAGQRAEELAWCMERMRSPMRLVVSKAYVGQAEDPDAPATRALAGYALARAGQALDRSDLAVAGGRNLGALLDGADAGLSIRALELLEKRGQARDLEQTLEVLAHARGRIPLGAPGHRSP